MTDLRHVVLALCLLIVAGCGSQHVAADSSEPVQASDPRGVWLAIRPTQCSDDPWRKDWISVGEEQSPEAGAANEIASMVHFFTKRGVNVIDYKIRREPITSCAACTCPGQDIAFLLVSEADAPTVAAFGFHPQQP